MEEAEGRGQCDRCELCGWWASASTSWAFFSRLTQPQWPDSARPVFVNSRHPGELRMVCHD
jgi:hypothetical protein